MNLRADVHHTVDFIVLEESSPTQEGDGIPPRQPGEVIHTPLPPTSVAVVIQVLLVQWMIGVEVHHAQAYLIHTHLAGHAAVVSEKRAYCGQFVGLGQVRTFHFSEELLCRLAQPNRFLGVEIARRFEESQPSALEVFSDRYVAALIDVQSSGPPTQRVLNSPVGIEHPDRQRVACGQLVEELDHPEVEIDGAPFGELILLHASGCGRLIRPRVLSSEETGQVVRPPVVPNEIDHGAMALCGILAQAAP
ncbi:MAG: hypothetical protein BWY92_01477 [Firmicutes bacterium ADurb.BinA052]|nr:MAG: hypothetical protein BWY92_01477 [Firmicutes bacterium ADurb.BinA052]